MSDLQKSIDKVLAEVFAPRLEKARVEASKRIEEELLSTVPKVVDYSATLNSSILTIQGASSQAETLGAMLDGAANFASRVALFVIKANNATGWQARGFSDNDAVKQITVDPTSGLAGRAMSDKMAVSAAAAEFSSEFVRILGNPGDGNAIVIPLVVRDKVPALLYADGGSEVGGKCDSSAVELVVRSTGWWLEISAARKSGAGAGADHTVTAPAPPPPPPVAAAPPPPPPPAPEPAPEPPPVAVAPPPPPPPPAPAPAAAAAAAPAVDIKPGDEELHKKAKRFAKLLVDEIKLYNQAKVAEGRKNHDLYDRLKDDIDKSRASYEKRYANTAAGPANYFISELVRILAENDATLLGSNFHG